MVVRLVGGHRMVVGAVEVPGIAAVVAVDRTEVDKVVGHS